jgi:signal transduction histidine kinase
MPFHSEPTIVFWFLTILPFWVVGYFLGSVPFESPGNVKFAFITITVAFMVLHAVTILLRRKISFKRLALYHIFTFPLVLLFSFTLITLSNSDRLYLLALTISFGIWLIPAIWHTGIKMGVYQLGDSYEELIFLLVMKSISILQTSIAAGFISFIILVDSTPEVQRTFIIINGLIQVPSMLLFIAVASRFGKPIAPYFRVDSTKRVLAAAFRRTQIYAYAIIFIILIFSFVGLSLYVIVANLLFAVKVKTIFLLVVIIFIFILGGQLYGLLSLRKVLTPLLVKISKSHIDHSKVRSPITLRFKLGLWFGLVIFIATAFSAYWSYVQYGKLVSNFLGRKAEVRLKAFETTLWNRLKYSNEIEVTVTVNLLIEQFSEYDDGYYYHFPTRGKKFSSGGKSEAPSLDVRTRSYMRRRNEGRMILPSLGLYGSFKRININGEYFGVIALLYPGIPPMKQGGPSDFGKMLIFFLVLLFMGLGGVAFFVTEYTKPLSRLEGTVAAITAGKFEAPVKPEGEADEIGRLSFILETMRTTIHEKISTIEKMNLNLEFMVEERTEDLEVANIELKEALVELEKAQYQLVQSGRLVALGKLLAGIAHEINNPVNAITNSLGPFNTLLSRMKEGNIDGDDTEDAIAMVGIITRGTIRIKEVIERITTTLRPTESPFQRVDLKEVIDNSMSLLSHELESVKISININETVLVAGHGGAFGQVLENLIVNSLSSMENSKKKVLSIDVAVEDNNAIVKISDVGTGIPNDIKDKIFDPFFTTKDVGKGMGLGLSIVHDIVRRYNGSISLESKEGDGTIVEIKLPLWNSKT